MSKISLEPYKGVRDFYPEERAVQNYIFRVWQKVAESYGYERYNASILEPLDLYKSKSNEEIVNEQIYSFKDRGDREVALRPEMTPTVARMIANKINEIPFPARWYSIGSFYRYEKPQRGRHREFWQLNVDLFGNKSISSDIEIVSMAPTIMKAFGAKEEDYVLYVNSRELMDDLYDSLEIPVKDRQAISRIIDKKDKISEETFRDSLKELASEKATEQLTSLLNSKNAIFEKLGDKESAKYLLDLLEKLTKIGIKNIEFNPNLVRGFDYYTGIIFEVFDTNKENNRSVFGGGRYDELVEMFSGKEVPAVGFGMGDVTIQNFLETHNLLPKFESTTKIWICLAPDTAAEEADKVGNKLRKIGINTAIDISGRKLGDQIAGAEKRKIPYVLVVGKDELEKGQFKLKNIETREEKECSLEEIVKMIQ
ncbi:MAG TPA: histidine--tRNA ligase [Candidatus Paceibacterota bacterium]